jgi:hypothetical protein
MARTSSRDAATLAATFASVVAIEAFARRHDITFAFVLHQHGALAAIAWAALLLASLAAVLWLFLAQDRRVELTSFVALASSFIVSFSFRPITGSGITVTTARLLLGEGGYGAEALAFHGPRAVLWSSFGVALMFLLRLVLRRSIAVRTRRPATALAVGWLGVLSVGSVFLPLPSVVPSFLGVPTAFAEALAHPPREVVRQPVTASRGPALATHVVLLVDESIRGDLLSLARPEVGTTPWLSARRGEIADFGIASSATNCSATSNATLLVGMRPSELPDRDGLVRSKPTIFDHAARAGYRTTLIDGQATDDRPPWALTPRDVAALDRWRVLRQERPDLPVSEVDRALLEAVVEATSSAEPSFVYATKRGAHYRYKSVLAPAARRDAELQAAALGFNELPITGTYLAALKHAVDAFFSELLPRLEGRDVLVVYTSDHGESLLEDGTSRTHCMEGLAAPEQGRVPLFVWHGLGASSPLFRRFADAARAAHHRARSFEVFPTLLVCMGYDEREVAADYGAILLDGAAPRRERAFFTGDILAKGAWWWNRIER